MIKEQQKKLIPPVFGGISLLMVFAVLCLTIFTMLTISTVTADKALSDKSAQVVAEYYAADLEAEITFSKIKNGEAPSFVSFEDGIYSYTQTINKSSAILVEVTNDNGVWQIITWKTITITQ